MASDSRKIMFMYPHRNKAFLKIAIALVKVALVQISYNLFLTFKTSLDQNRIRNITDLSCLVYSQSNLTPFAPL